METITSQQPSIDIVYDWFKPEGCPPDRNALKSLVSYPKLTKTGETVDVAFSVIKDEDNKLFRSEESRVGKECVSTCRSRWLTYHYKKKSKNNNDKRLNKQH